MAQLINTNDDFLTQLKPELKEAAQGYGKYEWGNRITPGEVMNLGRYTAHLNTLSHDEQFALLAIVHGWGKHQSEMLAEALLYSIAPPLENTKVRNAYENSFFDFLETVELAR